MPEPSDELMPKVDIASPDDNELADIIEALCAGAYDRLQRMLTPSSRVSRAPS